MKFGSVCSGIEAASVAWNSLGWEASWVAEIEPFPSAVLAHHYPDVPNLGDMTLLPEKILNGEIEAPDILCGGTPCQAFSVAGNRQSLDDARGNLTLTFCEIADAIDSRRDKPAIIFWENVPGVLNTKDNAFGSFLAKLAGEDNQLQPSGKRWTNSGVVFGHKRTVAWRILDAQYFGLAQRRKRVFVVASARDDFNPAEVLFEFEGVRRDTAPSRCSGKTTSNDAQSGIGTYNKQRISEYSTEDIASTCAARDYKDATDLVVNMIPLNTMTILSRPSDDLKPRMGSGIGLETDPSPTITKAHSHAVAYRIVENIINRQDHNGGNGNQDLGDGRGLCFEPRSADGVPRIHGDLCPTLNTMGGGQREPCVVDRALDTTTAGVHGVAYDFEPGIAKREGEPSRFVEEMTPTMRSEMGDNQLAVAFHPTQDPISSLEISHAITSGSTKGCTTSAVAKQMAVRRLTTTGVHGVAHPIAYSFDSLSSNSMKSGNPDSSVNQVDISKTLDTSRGLDPSCNQGGIGLVQPTAVRRLTPRECERLQGFPDDYTKITYRNKSADNCPDGPRYKALGNSWAVPVVRWIGERIAKGEG